MMNLIAKWFIVALSLFAVAEYVPGINVATIYTALIVALLLGLINVTVRPLLILLTLPINIVTFGLFTFVINAFLFWFVSTFVENFEVTGFWSALLGALIVSVLNYIADVLLSRNKK